MINLMPSSSRILRELGATVKDDECYYDGIIFNQREYPGLIQGIDFKCNLCGNREAIVWIDPNAKKSWLLCGSGDCNYEQVKGSYVSKRIFLNFSDYVTEPYTHARLSSATSFPKDLVTEMRRIAEKKRGVVVISGPNGVGKTWIACASACHYIDEGGNDLRIANSVDLYLDFQEQIEEFGNARRLHSSLCEKEFLVIDDFGLRTPSDSWKEFVYLIIEKRINSQYATIITTNLNHGEIAHAYGKALASRLNIAKCFKLTGSDRRIKTPLEN